MQLSNRRLTESVIEMLERLQGRSELPSDVIYDLNIAAAVLTHTDQVDRSNGEAVRDYARRTASLGRDMLSSAHVTDDVIKARLAAAIEAADKVAVAFVGGDAAKQALSALLVETEAEFIRIGSESARAATPLFAAFALPMLELHHHLPAYGPAYTGREHEISAGEILTEANLTAYFRDKFSDPSASVTNVTALPGGFGKETTLLTLATSTFTADLVVRRDPAIDALDRLDCHSAAKEYPLLKAVHARGFPAPEPICFDAGGQLIAGPAFTVMRRAPGGVSGDATGGSSKVTTALQQSLAGIVARLHNVAPLTELSDNPMFANHLWHSTVSACTRQYIGAWHRQFMATPHSAAPVLQGIFHWLLAHIPQSEVATTLIHGDIGFHNLLFHEGRISAVLDWEFGHIGDPAEDLGYIRSVMGDSLDWPKFLRAYGDAGRPIPSEQRIRFFEIWSHARNAAASVMITDHFERGHFRGVKYAMLAIRFIPHFISRAHVLIREYVRDFRNI